MIDFLPLVRMSRLATRLPEAFLEESDEDASYELFWEQTDELQSLLGTQRSEEPAGEYVNACGEDRGNE